MRRAIFCIFATVALISLWAQSTSQTVVQLEHSNSLSFDKERFPDRQILRGDVQFSHDNVRMYCDSAYFYSERNSLDAFSNIKIVQGDTLFIYGDVLYYDGNTKLARLRGNVRMENRSVTLLTDNFDFDRLKNVGYYFDGGEIIDTTNTLVSTLGYYYPDTKIAIFNQEAVLTNPKFTLHSDTLQYNTNTAVAYIVGPSNIYHEDTQVYSEQGWYNTKIEQAELTKNSHIRNREGRFLRGDTLFYDKLAGTVVARQNIEMLDSLRQITLRGNKGFYDEIKEFGRITDRALLLEHSSADTLFLSADTITTQSDSIYTKAHAFYHVRFFRNDFQGKSDSLTYSSRDSVLTLYTAPVVWSETSQLSGEVIRAHFNGENLDRVQVVGSAMAVSQDDSTRFNQVSGKEIIGFFRDSVMYRAETIGNVRSIYFAREDDGTLLGVNKVESSLMIMYFENGEMHKIVMMPEPQGTFFPPEQLSGEDLKLDSFQWLDDIRPKTPEDIFLKFDAPKATEQKGRRRKN
ncbi:MAG: hypothetical protein LBR75_06575 [Prevotellaceae bacterium]|jgi:lipopolysaccharide export system protein LptA|nr:hypothetical protein [Prevotellaceae bacterium]